MSIEIQKIDKSDESGQQGNQGGQSAASLSDAMDAGSDGSGSGDEGDGSGGAGSDEGGAAAGNEGGLAGITDAGQGGQSDPPAWKSRAESLGIDAESEDEFFGKIKSKIDAGSGEKPSAYPNGNKEWNVLNQTKSLNNEELMRAIYKDQGLPEDVVNKQIEKLKKNDDLDFVAAQSRSNINKRMADIEADISRGAEQRRADDDAKAQKEAESYKENVTRVLSKTSEVFGLQVGKDDAGKAAWREKMSTYITDGKFTKQINDLIRGAIKGDESSTHSLIEVAQFLAARDGLSVGLKNIGVSQGKEQVLDHLRNPDDAELPAKGGHRQSDGKREPLPGWA